MNELQPTEGERVTSKSLKIAGHVFTPVIFSDGTKRKLHKFSQREGKFLDRFLKTGSVDLAAKEIGVTHDLGLRYMKRAPIRAYLSDMISRQALAAGVTVDALMAELAQGIFDGKEISETKLECIKVAARILKPASGGVNVTVNTQNNFAVPSAYTGTAEALAGQFRAALQDLP